MGFGRPIIVLLIRKLGLVLVSTGCFVAILARFEAGSTLDNTIAQPLGLLSYWVVAVGVLVALVAELNVQWAHLLRKIKGLR